MNSVLLTERLIKTIVLDPDMVTVKEFPSEDPKKVIIQVLVSEDDLKRVIGKGGRTINAVRTLVATNSSLHDHKYITINVESF